MHTDTCQDIAVQQNLPPPRCPFLKAVLRIGSIRCFPATPRPFSGTFGLCHVTQEPQEISRLGFCPHSPQVHCHAVCWVGSLDAHCYPGRLLEKRGPELLSVRAVMTLRLLQGLSCPDLMGPPAPPVLSRPEGHSSLRLAGKERGNGSSKAALTPKP